MLPIFFMARSFLIPTTAQWLIDHPEYNTPAYPPALVTGILTLAYNTYTQIDRLKPDLQITAFELAVCHQRQLMDRESCGIDGILTQLKSRNDSQTFAETRLEDAELASTSCGRSLYNLLMTVAGGLHVNSNNIGCCQCLH